MHCIYVRLLLVTHCFSAARLFRALVTHCHYQLAELETHTEYHRHSATWTLKSKGGVRGTPQHSHAALTDPLSYNFWTDLAPMSMVFSKQQKRHYRLHFGLEEYTSTYIAPSLTLPLSGSAKPSFLTTNALAEINGIVEQGMS